jgi:hypothetical protein
MSAHIGGVRRTRALGAHCIDSYFTFILHPIFFFFFFFFFGLTLAAAGGMMTDALGMAGTPEHAKNTRPQTSKCSHLIYCEGMWDD